MLQFPLETFFQLHRTAVAHRNRNLSPHFWGGELLLIYFSHMLNCKCGTIFVFDNCFVYSRECFSAPGWHMRVTQLELVMCLIWNSQSVPAVWLWPLRGFTGLKTLTRWAASHNLDCVQRCSCSSQEPCSGLFEVYDYTHTDHKMMVCNLSMIYLHWRGHNNANQYSLNAVLQSCNSYCTD